MLAQQASRQDPMRQCCARGQIAAPHFCRRQRSTILRTQCVQGRSRCPRLQLQRRPQAEGQSLDTLWTTWNSHTCNEERMTHRHSNSRSDRSVPPRALRLIQRRPSQTDASQQSDGIRPTRQGPWDPCRFQEYELSPEFRRQVMLAKLPPAAPNIFRDTIPPTQVTDTDVAPIAPIAPLTTAAHSMTTLQQVSLSKHKLPRRGLKSAAVVVALVAAAALAILLIRHVQRTGHGADAERVQSPLSPDTPAAPLHHWSIRSCVSPML